MYLSFNHTLEAMKNTTYIDKCLEFDTVILTFIKKNTLSYINITKKNGFCLRKGCFIGPQNELFRLKRGVFSSKIRKRGGGYRPDTWWRHQMETFSALLALCAGNSPVPGEFPSQRPVTKSFDVFFDLRLNKRLSKQPWGWWFETPSCSLWRHCNDLAAL